MPNEVACYSDARGLRVAANGVTLSNVAYPLASIASVSTHVEQPGRIGPLVVIAIGVWFFVEEIAQASLRVAVLAASVAAVGVFWFRECKPVHYLDLLLVSGERVFVAHGSERRINAIAKAINEAIALRTETPNVSSAPLLNDEQPAASVSGP